MHERQMPTSNSLEVPPALTDIDHVSRLASEIAYQHNLDLEAYEELTKFAQINLRLKQINKLFKDNNVSSIDYEFHAPGERKQKKITFKKDTFQLFQSALSWVAFSMFDNLNKNPNSALAAKEIILITNDVYPVD